MVSCEANLYNRHMSNHAYKIHSDFAHCRCRGKNFCYTWLFALQDINARCSKTGPLYIQDKTVANIISCHLQAKLVLCSWKYPSYSDFIYLRDQKASSKVVYETYSIFSVPQTCMMYNNVGSSFCVWKATWSVYLITPVPIDINRKPCLSVLDRNTLRKTWIENKAQLAVDSRFSVKIIRNAFPSHDVMLNNTHPYLVLLEIDSETR